LQHLVDANLDLARKNGEEKLGDYLIGS